MSVVAQRYGYSVQYEVMNDQVGRAFSDAATEAKLRVAGTPRITQKDVAPEGQMAFDATFEVYPEVQIGDLSSAEIESASAEVTEEAIDRTVEILRKQRRTFAQRPAGEGAAGDRPRHHRLRRQDRRRGLRRRQGRGLPVHHRRRPDAGAVRQGRARHEGGRVQDLPAAVPGRLPRQGRGRQGSRLPRQRDQDRGAEAARGGRGLRQGAGHRGRHRAGPARQRQEEPGARGDACACWRATRRR